MKRIRLGAAGRGVLALLSGTAGAQLIQVGAIPILSRLYSPADFGYFSITLALAGIVAPIATLRFESAVVLPDSISHVRALTWISFISMTSIAVIYGVVLHTLSSVGVTDVSNYEMLSIWVPAFVWLTAVFTFLSQLVLRQRKYKLVARRSLYQAVVSAFSQIGLGVVAQGVPGLLIGRLTGRVTGIFTMFRHASRYLKRPDRGHLGFVWRRYWRFPALFTPSALLNAFGLQAPLIFITASQGISAGGQVGMAERIVAIPVVVLGSAIAQAIDAEASKVIREKMGSLTQLYAKFSIFLALCGLLVGVGGWLLGEWLVPVLLGSEWMTAGTVVKIIAVTSAVRLVASPLSRFIILLQRSAANIVLDVIRILLMAGAMLMSISLSFDLIETVWAVYSSLTITYGVTWLYGLFLVKKAALK